MNRTTTGKSQQLNTYHPGCLILFALFWIAFSSLFFLIGLITDAGILFILFGLFFVGIGVVMLIYAIMSLFSRYKIGKPEFYLSATTLKIGQRFDFSANHTFPRRVTIEQIRTSLIFREEATYQQGTDTKTVTHDHIIATHEEPGGHFQPGHLLNLAYQFEIPQDGMHSLKVRRNELIWLLKVEMKIPKLPDFVEELPLTVLPEITTT